jgi:hypothetical protein
MDGDWMAQTIFGFHIAVLLERHHDILAASFLRGP